MKGWHQPLVSLLEATGTNNISGHPAYDRDPYVPMESSTSSCRVVFMGDAGHPMSPFKGQGANQALLDAISLSRAIASSNLSPLSSLSSSSLSKKRSYKEALREYEVEMSRRSSVKVLKSRR